MSESNTLTITAFYDIDNFQMVPGDLSMDPPPPGIVNKATKPTSLTVNFNLDVPYADTIAEQAAPNQIDQKLTSIMNAVKATALGSSKFD